MSSTFTRKREDFCCENCGAKISGNGYTNHCSTCLYSKHVDVNPGDRKNSCGGLMKPISVELKKGSYVIVHRCIKCATEKRNKSAEEDSMEAILAVAKSFAEKGGR